MGRLEVSAAVPLLSRHCARGNRRSGVGRVSSTPDEDGPDPEKAAPGKVSGGED